MQNVSNSSTETPAGDPVVAAAMRGNGEAIRALWEQHRRWIAAVLLAHKPSFEELEDLLQEVVVVFVSKVNTLREETNLRAWLRVIAVNTARAAARSGKYRPRQGLSEEIVESFPRSVDEQVASREQAGRLMQRLRSLPESYREPLLLRAMNGMRSRQIAEILAIEPATVDTRIARARRMLQEATGGEPNLANNGVASGDEKRG